MDFDRIENEQLEKENKILRQENKLLMQHVLTQT